MASLDDTYSVAQAAQILGMSGDRVRELMAAGRLRSGVVNGHQRPAKEHVDEIWGLWSGPIERRRESP